MNQDVKLAMFKANLKQFQLAQLLNIHEGNLSKLLNRQELSKEKKKEIFDVINKVKEEHKNDTFQ